MAVLLLGDLLAGSLEFIRAFDSPPRCRLIVVEVQVMKDVNGTEIQERSPHSFGHCSTRDLFNPRSKVVQLFVLYKSAIFSYKYKPRVIPATCDVFKQVSSETHWP